MDNAASSDQRQPLADERLAAVGLAALAWLLCAGILVMFRATPAASAASERGMIDLAQLGVPLLAGILWQSSAASRSSASRLRRAVGLWAGWSMAGLGAALVPRYWQFPNPWSWVDLGLQQAGIVLGITIGWVGPQALATRLNDVLRACEAIARGIVAAASIAIILVPLSPDASLLDPSGAWHISSPVGYLKALPGQAYLALKSLVLWVPVGMLYSLARKHVQVKHWAIAASLAFLVVGLPLLLHTLTVQDVLEVLSAYWGIVIGVWLGAQLSRTLPQEAADSQRLAVERSGATPPVTTGASPPGTALIVLARRAGAIVLLVGVGAWSLFFPRWGVPLTLALALYALALARYRDAWLLVVPAALPLLNLAPGTGRFFFDEFDLLMLTTVAMALWHGANALPRPTLSRPLAIALVLLGCSIAVSLVIGLLPLSPLDANAFTSYWSHYNSLRTAKGFLWALSLLLLMLWTLPAGISVMRLFVPGMWLGLAGVIAVGLWERALFAGLLDLRVPYRITATFSSMHTGGSEIETYLVIAIPFVWLAFASERPVLVKLAGVCLLVLGAYLTTLTIARAGVFALGVALCIVLLGAWRGAQSKAEGRRAAIVAAVALCGVAVALAFGLTGAYLQKRLADSEEDLAVRVSHWQHALAMRDPDWSATIFGMGLGRFPETYLFRSDRSSLPGTYRFEDDNGNRFLRLGSGETLYMAQRVSVVAGRRYTLSLRARTRSANARLGVPLCEKHLLDSLRCQWQAISLPADGSWHAQSLTIDSGMVGAGNWLSRRPVELSLYNETGGSRIDVDDVQLQDDTGKPLIRNGDFSAGGDYWFFKTHSHLPWHIKNLWVEILFDQGWFGLASFVLLLAVVLSHLAHALWRGHRIAGVLLAAMGGLLTVGLFGSLFDSPRIATLFFLLVVLAGTAVAANDSRARADPA